MANNFVSYYIDGTKMCAVLQDLSMYAVKIYLYIYIFFDYTDEAPGKKVKYFNILLNVFLKLFLYPTHC